VKKPAPAKKAPAKKAATAVKKDAKLKAAKAAPKPAAPKKAAAKAVAKPKPEPAKKAPAPKAAKPAPKAAAKTAAKANGKAPEAPKQAKAKAAPPKKTPAPAAKAKAAAPAPKPAPEPKPAKPAKAAKPPKPKKEKPPKLAPVAAALAKPIPAKPLAVAAGRAQPLRRALATPAPRAAPKPLSAPKPVTPEPEVVGDLQAVPAFKARAAGAKGMVLVGAIAGAFGVKGEVRLRAFTAKPEGVISYGPLYDEHGKPLLKPKSWRQLKDGVAVAAPEVKTKEQADKMRGAKLYVPRANLPAAGADEFYIVDLLGCRAEALDGKVLGEICAVWNFGAGDIIEYRPPNGGPNVRVTFTRETAPLVDLAGKRVVLDPPAPEPVGK